MRVSVAALAVLRVPLADANFLQVSWSVAAALTAVRAVGGGI